MEQNYVAVTLYMTSSTQQNPTDDIADTTPAQSTQLQIQRDMKLSVHHRSVSLKITL